MAFQAEIAQQLVAALISGVEVGSGLGVAPNRVVRLQCEARDAVDDIVATLENGWRLFFQCKTNVALSTTSNSPLASTISQLVRLRKQLAGDTNSRVILAAGSNSASTLRTLEQGLRLFDSGGDWDATVASASSEVANALRLFASHAQAEQPALSKLDLAALAQMFTVVRFEGNGLSSIFGSNDGLAEVYGTEHATAARTAIKVLARELVASGAPADRLSLLRTLRIRGQTDVDFPLFAQDFRALRNYSTMELRQFSRHEKLTGSISIERDCLAELRAVVDSGSVVVTGEPGCGKTGLLVALARRLLVAHPNTIFISAENLSGLATKGQLDELVGTQHPLIDVLANWPGPTPRFLVIDSLDATRGGHSERLLQRLISDVLATGDWTVVASVRDFDLRVGRRWRELFHGPPASTAYSNAEMSTVRHFATPLLTDAELSKLAEQSKSICELLSSAPSGLTGVLRNVFNLSIAAEMRDYTPVNLADIRTQSDLLSQYEDIRIDSQPLRRAAVATVKTIERLGALRVRNTDVETNELDALVQRGVLTTNSDRVSFTHHVLFDHITARYYLDHDDADRLAAQVKTGIQSLLLAPALKFCVEIKFKSAVNGFWSFLVSLSASEASDPLVSSVALSTAVSLVNNATDVEGLVNLVSDSNSGSLGKVLEKLSRLYSIAAEGTLSSGAHDAWVRVARSASDRIDDQNAEAVRFFLFTLDHRCVEQSASFKREFGLAARALLNFAWTNGQRTALAPLAIRLVAKSFETDPQSSRTLLAQIIRNRLDTYGPVEAPALAAEFDHIFTHAPDFAEDVFTSIFSHKEDDNSPTALGGSQSRILGLTSNRRQDYQHAEWLLMKKLDAFFSAHPLAAARSVSRAVTSTFEREHPSKPVEVTELGNVRIAVLPSDYRSLLDWRVDQYHDNLDEMLRSTVDFLRQCEEPVFLQFAQEAARSCFCVPMWARLLGVAAERALAPADLWTLASAPEVCRIDGLQFDSVEFLIAALPRQTVEARRAYELRIDAALRSGSPLDPDEQDILRKLVARVLHQIPDQITPEFDKLRSELATTGAVQKNRPLASMSVEWTHGRALSETTRFPDVELGAQPNRTLRDSTIPLEQVLQDYREQRTFSYSSAWTHIASLISEVEASSAAAPPVVAAAWGAIAATVELVAADSQYQSSPVNPTPDELAQLAVRLAGNPYPKARSASEEIGDRSLAWSDLDVRVFAARALLELAGSGTARVATLEQLSQDRAASVRFQIVSSLTTIWAHDEEAVWRIATTCAKTEENPQLIQALVSRTLVQLARIDATRTEALLAQIESRFGGRADDHREPMHTVGILTAWLIIVKEEQGSRARLDAWTSSSPMLYSPLCAAIQELRTVTFATYHNDSPVEPLYSVRTRALLSKVVSIAAETIKNLEQNTTTAVTDDQRAEYLAASRILDEVCSQLYFGSGAFEGGRDKKPGLPNAEARARFLSDFATTLDSLATHSTAGGVHKLAELLDFLVDGDPSAVFGLLAKMLLGRGRSQQYHLESLGADHTFAIVGRYLADFRSVFEEGSRRSELLGLLGLFADAGWPAAHRLLYSLPDAFR